MALMFDAMSEVLLCWRIPILSSLIGFLFLKGIIIMGLDIPDVLDIPVNLVFSVNLLLFVIYVCSVRYGILESALSSNEENRVALRRYCCQCLSY